MKKHGLLLERHTGRRRPREHDGQVIAIRSNIRWCSDALEFTCWNGEVVRVAFALDCHDREVIAWVATTAGISGEMIRDMMVHCVERRFGSDPRAASGAVAVGQRLDLRRPQDHRDRPGAQPRALLHARSKARRATAWPRPSSKPSSATMSASARSPMPLPRSPSSKAGWRTTTPFTLTPGWATAHPASTSLPNPNPLRVRSDRVNSMMFLKTLVRNAVRRCGYHIQKYPITRFSPVSVFDLSIQLLMAVRGQRLNFIQVGANDGKSGDPLHRYILNYPWHGILVEPQPDIFAKLRENYAAIANRLIFENIAIATGLSTIAMYKNPSGHPNSEAAFLVSTSPQVAARSFRLRAKDLERFFVPCATLDELVRKHSMSNIDVLQIDAEGGDFDVLKTLRLYPKPVL